MLSVEHASRTFANGNTAFREVSFTSEQGEIIGLLGTSGCGKSTLLRVISGLDTNYKGTVTIDGETVKGINEKMGSIFQEPRLMPWLTVLDNILFGLKGSKQKKREAAKRFVQLVGLEGSEGLYPRELSGGMAQRVAVARSLVTSPEILLLDEPFSAVDALTKMQLQDLLLDIWGESRPTLLLVTHDIDEALHLCDRILVLRGKPGTLFREISVEQPHPRTRGDRELAMKKEEILRLLDFAHHEILNEGGTRRD